MEKIGRYRLSQRLGAGSFATVWRGHDDDLDVDVAVKVLAENWSSNDDVRNRFLGEARLLRKIQDERIVRVYDIGTTENGQPYFVMDFANGGSLEDLRRNLVPPGRALRLCAEAARALEVLHREGVIHRDVTPGNILLSYAGSETRVLLADLGVAKKMIGQQGATMTAGTPAYMALEQATGVGTLDQRADIYSIAAVAYSLLTGRPPFPVKTLPDLLARNPNVDPAPIADQIAAPPMLDHLFASALSPQPGRRPQSAEIIATAFDQIADLLPGGDTYTPRPLAPAAGASSGPATPAYTVGLGGTADSPITSPPGYQSLVPGSLAGQSQQAYGAQASANYPSPVSIVGSYGPIASPTETPASLLQSYLGPESTYAPARAKERHTAAFYITLSAGAVLLFGLTLLLTVALFG
jgi:serine/threonine protein kinase